MKKFLIGTTALITAGMLVSSVANAQVTNANDNIKFELSGSIKSTIAFGTNSAMSNYKKDAKEDLTQGISAEDAKAFKNSIRNFDIWNEGDLEATAGYTASDEMAKVKSVEAHITLVDGKLVSAKDLSMYVETDTAFGNIILGDKNFTSVMGVVGNYDDDTGSDYKEYYKATYLEDKDSLDTHGQISGVMEFTDDDLADDIESRIQYNTGDLIKLDENSKIVIGASVALSPENSEYTKGEFGVAGDDRTDINDQGFSYFQGNMANLVIAGGASYSGVFGGTSVFAVGTFQHTNGLNAFNVSTKVGINDALQFNGGFSMLMYGDYTKQNGEKTKKDKDEGPVMTFYGAGSYTINDITLGAGGHFAYQGYGSQDTQEANKTGKISVHYMEIGVSAEATMALTENVNWTMAKVNFDMSQNNNDYNSADKFGGMETAFGLQSVIKVSF